MNLEKVSRKFMKDELLNVLISDYEVYACDELPRNREYYNEGKLEEYRYITVIKGNYKCGNDFINGYEIVDTKPVLNSRWALLEIRQKRNQSNEEKLYIVVGGGYLNFKQVFNIKNYINPHE